MRKGLGFRLSPLFTHVLSAPKALFQRLLFQRLASATSARAVQAQSLKAQKDVEQREEALK